MALTKKDQALIQELRNRAALTLPPYERPVPMDTDTATRINPTVGFGIRGEYIESQWSRADVHGTMPLPNPNGYTGGSKGPGILYATKLEALKELRWRVTQECMTKLGRLDAQIEEESK